MEELKKPYLSPEMQIVWLGADDIICVSGTNAGDPDVSSGHGGGRDDWDDSDVDFGDGNF